MTKLIVVIHVMVCFALILIVLLQVGKGAAIGALFGGVSDTIFGGRGATSFLEKLTTGAAAIFMITCLLLTYQSSQRTTASVMEDYQKKETKIEDRPVEEEKTPPLENKTGQE